MNHVQRPAKTSGLAISSLVLGILSLLCFSIIAGIPAIICGHVGRSNIKTSMGNLGGGGMALAGLILGYISIGIVILGIIAAIAIPGFSEYLE